LCSPGLGEGALEQTGSDVVDPSPSVADEFCLLRAPPASRARSTDACDVRLEEPGTCGKVAVLVLRALRLLRLDDERCWRVGIGCVGPVLENSEGESAESKTVLEFVEDDVLLPTEADCCARRAESSRVRRLTCLMKVER